MAEHASQLYARNVASLLELMTGEEGALTLDFDDPIIAGAVHHARRRDRPRGREARRGGT